MVTLIRSDLDFILDQIKISERHAAGEDLTDILPNIELPWGVRTVDGTYNNLLPNQENFGAADTEFPRSLPPNFIDQTGTPYEDGFAFGPPIIDTGTGQPLIVPGVNGPGTTVPPGYLPGVGGNWLNRNDYTPNGPNLTPNPRDIEPSDVVDADPRIISRLIVDQTVTNFAAILSALKFVGIEGAEASAALADIQLDVPAFVDARTLAKQADLLETQAGTALSQALAAQAGAVTANAEAQALLAAYSAAVTAASNAQPVLTTAALDAQLLVNELNNNGSTLDAADDTALANAIASANAALVSAQAIVDELAADPNVDAADLARAEDLVTGITNASNTLLLVQSVLADNDASPADIIAAQGYASEAAANLADLIGSLADPTDGLQDQLDASFADADAAATIAATVLSTADQEVSDAQTTLATATTNSDNADAALVAAQADINAKLDSYGIEYSDNGTLSIPNVAPDEGLSAPFNSWMTLFGQFFDHGLDLVAKGGHGTVYIPLQEDDPLFVPGSSTNFMVVTRSTLNENGEAINLTTPHVDQNQTYTSHASMQVFHREYEMREVEDPNNPGSTILVPKATGGLLNGAGGGLANWAEVKAQALEKLGIELDDLDILNGPLLATDQYGNFIPGPDGFPQIVTDAGPPPTLASGTPGAPVDASDALRTGHAFLDDIAHNANPAGKTADADDIANPITDRLPAGTYDDELLDRHFITGDGRGNENIGLTTVHHVFHSEHNRMLAQIKDVLIQDVQDQLAADPTLADADALRFINEWLDVPVTSVAELSTPENLVWNGERLFQAAKLPTEMQYQHLVFEEFARKVQPFVNVFNDYDAALNPAILAEFAHTVYRFGHSMLNETVDLFDSETGETTEVGLIEAFLNPLGFHQQVQADGTLPDGADPFDPELAAGLIVQGMTRQRGNAIDEHVTEALHNNLLGLPLDLAAINIGRGRETGVPTLNQARAEFYAGTNDSQLKPYESWLDFALNIKNPASIINFIAAYGTHEAIQLADTVEAKRDAAMALVLGDGNDADGVEIGGIVYTDRFDFLNAEGAYAGGDLAGMNNVDFWVGGLAEKTMIFGGMLGSTFNFVFETQLEALQNGDRFYYLNRLANLNLTAQLENNKFSEMIHRNTDATHLPGDVFSTPDFFLEVDQSKQHTGIENPNSPLSVDEPLATVNGTFEANSLADDGAGPVNEDPVRGNWTTGSPDGWSLTGTGGLFNPTAVAIAQTGHGGENVAWLTAGALLAQDTGHILVEGRDYTLAFNVGDRIDQAGLANGTVRLIAVNGTDVQLISETALTLTDGAWTSMSVSTGAIGAALAGYELRLEFAQGGGSNQILIDDVQLSASTLALNGDPTHGDPILDAITPLVQRGPGFLRFNGAEHVVLGGTEGDDTIIAGLGDDTVWGDGGNDRIEGGQGNDLIFGGDGDDIITDLFGDDEIRSGGGNDAVHAGPGLDLIITDTGSDWVVGGNDGVETLAGQGNDFVFAGTGSDFVIGGEGNDWLEGGGENNLLLGDNGDLVQGLPIKRSVTSTIEGHDVLLSSDGNEDFDAEQGDDIMVGGLGTDRFFGQFGYDWATYFTDPYGLEADMNVRLFAPPATPGSPASILDRYNTTEALSGSQFGDILRGDDEDDLIAGGVVDLNLDNGLYWRNVSLIDGLEALINSVDAADRTTDVTGLVAFSAGNILLGGDGSDIIEGRGGNDIIDGDHYLNVRLEVRDANGVALGTTDRMLNDITLTIDGVTETKSLSEFVFAGQVNPGNIHIVREILNTTTDNDATSATYDGDFDTVLFSDILANYTVTNLANGGVRVQHNTAGTTDGLGVDGIDTVFNIERLQFADQDVILVPGLNNEPQGQPTISGLFAVGETLTATIGTITDADIPGGVPAPADVDFFWEVDLGAGFEPITFNIADELVPVRGPTFELTVEQEGFPVRVRAVFRDGNGVLEQVFSDATDIIAPVFVTVATPGDDNLLGTINADTINALAGNDIIIALAGNDIINPGPGNDIIDGGPGNDTAIFLGDINNFALALSAEGELEVIDRTDPLNPEENLIVSDANGVPTVETLQFGNNPNNANNVRNAAEVLATLQALAADPNTDPGEISARAAGNAQDNILAGIVGNNDTLNGAGGNDLLFGLDGNDTLIGGAGDDELFGGSGDDTLTGGTGLDAITGGTGNDTINGGGGDDAIFWATGDGSDVVNGGGGIDVFDITSNGGETYEIIAVRSTAAIDNSANRSQVELEFGGLAANTEIVIVRTDLNNPLGPTRELVAQLDNIEELVINTLDGAPVQDPNNPGQGLPFGLPGIGVVPIGNFNATSLALNTITINGSSGNDTVDISGLDSAHRIVFRTMGGEDVVVGTLRAQDVIELAPGLTPGDYGAPVYNGNGTWTLTQTGGGHSVTYTGGATMPAPTFAAGAAAPTTHPAVNDGFTYSAEDLSNLKKLVTGVPLGLEDDDAQFTGIRDFDGTGNNEANPNYGSVDQPFIRLTDARYGEADSDGNRAINPIFNGLDPRTISNVLGHQESDLQKNALNANIFFMAFGQYFDHGLDFLPKGGNGTIAIGGVDNPAVFDPDNPADLNRGSVFGYDADGNPLHLNKASPFVDQNQAYGSTELVGQFLREADDDGTLTARLLVGGVDPSNPDFRLLPTLREAILHHWEKNTLFSDEKLLDQGFTTGSVHFRDYYNGLIDADGNIDTALAHDLNDDFMGSGNTLIGDNNGFINILEHYVAGDLRANENYTLTAMHTVWARNHNYHVDKLAAAGFEGSPEEIFQAAKIVNEAEYQRVVFDEFADYLLGGLRGSGDHGHDEYNPAVDARISHEFAAAVYRVGHSLIGQNITIMDDNGQPKEVPLFDAFLNPTNDVGAFEYTDRATGTTYYGQDALDKFAEFGYEPQPGFQQIGVSNVLGGIVQQQAEEVDFNLVDAVRNDLVRIRADLFAFNVARGWDVGLGTLNQIRMDLANSTNPYIEEAIELSDEDMSPYASWEDFQARNGLSDEVIAQFKEAYPDLILAADEIAQFRGVNPNITVAIQSDGTGVVKGIDRVDLWVGGLAEKHINGGMVGSTFWVVLHEQFDRLQEGDRFYYLDRVGDLAFYENLGDFSDIVARNTGLEGLPSDIFRADEVDGADDGDQPDGGDTAGDDGDTGSTGDDSNDGDAGGAGSGAGSGGPVPLNLVGTEGGDALIGGELGDVLVGLGGGDAIVANGGDDTVLAGSGDDILNGGEGDDWLIAEDGADKVIAGGGNDFVDGGAGDDLILGGAGDDMIIGGTGNDWIDAGSGDDMILAQRNDGDDVINGGAGTDTYDLSATTADATIDLGLGAGFGSAESDQIGLDTLRGVENVVGGAGNDTIYAGSGVNVMAGGIGEDAFVFRTSASADGDTILDFQAGDTVDISGIASELQDGATQFQLVLDAPAITTAGDVIFRHEQRADGEYTVLEGHLDDDQQVDFTINIAGRHNSGDFNI